MTPWTWVLVGLSAAAVLLVLASFVPVLRMLLRLRSRAKELQRARLFTAAESLELQRKHLEHIAAQAAPLAQRAASALGHIRNLPEEAGYADMRAAMIEAGAELASLVKALG